MRPADGDGGHDVVGVARSHDADRHLAVVRGVAGVQRLRAGVEEHITANGAAQRAGELLAHALASGKRSQGHGLAAP